jgi:phage minor structural protein
MIELYDKDLNFLGPADHVTRHGYTLKLNELSGAQIEAPVGDPVNERITVGASFARIWDGESFIGTFRFASAAAGHESGGTVSYSLDGAECTLLDDIIPGHLELGGTGMPTADVLTAILSYQTTRRWRVGTCDFSDEFQYNFEDVTLLEAIMSLGEVLTEDYRIVFDTYTTPWTVSFVRLSGVPEASLTYHRNLQRMKRTIDGALVTRLYGRGYGEGDNQLTIASVNNGRPYIDAPAEIRERYGTRCGIHVDTRQTDAETLMAQMQRILAAGQTPRVSYDVTAVDLYRESGEAWDRMDVGAMVRVLDETLPEEVSCRVTQLEKADVDGDPGGLKVVLDTGGADTAEQLNEVLEKIGVHELYSQGATSMYSIRGAENADSTHPMELDFYIPGNVLRINSCLLKWKKQPYRVDFRMAASAGGSQQTSASGGGATITTAAVRLTPEYVTTGPTYADGDPIGTLVTTVADGSVGNHYHNVSNHHHKVSLLITIPPQELQVSAHSHTVNIPAHTHELTYGIANGGSTADSVTIEVDGTYVPASEGEIDITEYLERDANGKIRRGTWHTVRFQPDGNARIVATLFIQQFLQSRGGGDY